MEKLTKEEQQAVINSVKGTILELEYRTIATESLSGYYLDNLKSALPKLIVLTHSKDGKEQTESKNL